jgi:hypothetical protein
MRKKDALAVIDLAETCSIFEQAFNYKATGVCYNNMANFQYKNESYNMAIKNYDSAILLAEVCLHEKKPEVFFNHLQKDLHGHIESKKCPNLPDISPSARHYFEVTRAHRVYQRAMCKYKEMRYHGGT